MQFRLRTLLVIVTVVAVALAVWPSTYNWFVLRTDEFERETKEWIERVKPPDDPEFSGLSHGTPDGTYVIDNTALTPQFLPSGKQHGFTHDPGDLTRTDAYWIWPPGEWVDSKEEAVQVWKREYVKQHGWRWW